MSEAPETLTVNMEFCSAHSRDIGEPLPGLGYLPRRMVLLTRPKGLWGPTVPQGKDLDPALRDALEVAADADDLRVQFVHRAGVTVDHDRFELTVFPDRCVWTDLSSEQAALIIRRLVDGGKPPEGARPMRDTVVLCCTDAKVDACCARFGYAAYRAITEAARHHDGIEVWETSHVGGCRLAASCIVLPQRARYSRVDPAQAASFVAAVAAGRIYLPFYRGHPDLDDEAQVAHAAALSWAARHDLPEIAEILDCTDLEDGRKLFRVAVGGTVTGPSPQRLEITCASKDFNIFSNCEDRRDGLLHPFSRWIMTDIRELSV